MCTAGTPLNCNDGNVCTTDTCNPATGCTTTPVANGTSCADGNVCNGARDLPERDLRRGHRARLQRRERLHDRQLQPGERLRGHGRS